MILERAVSKDAGPRADHGLAIALNIPRNTNARRKIAVRGVIFGGQRLPGAKLLDCRSR